MTRISLVEIFRSLQGEGANTGRPVVFVRLAGCNLACHWCDTPRDAQRAFAVSEIVSEVRGFDCQSVVLTGGEPLVRPEWPELVRALKAEGWWIALETNGTVPLTAEQIGLFDYVAASPKVAYADRYQPGTMLALADEVRIVVDGPDTEAFCRSMRTILPASRYFLSPCDRPTAGMNILETVTLLGRLNASAPVPPWELSMQTHKLAGFA